MCMLAFCCTINGMSRGAVQVFFTTWWLGVFWWVTYVINRNKVRNWFRKPTDLEAATHVYVWTAEKREVLTVNIWALVKFVRRLKVWRSSSQTTSFLLMKSCGKFRHCSCRTVSVD